MAFHKTFIDLVRPAASSGRPLVWGRSPGSTIVVLGAASVVDATDLGGVLADAVGGVAAVELDTARPIEGGEPHPPGKMRSEAATRIAASALWPQAQPPFTARW
jgi:hypothetical protein